MSVLPPQNSRKFLQFLPNMEPDTQYKKVIIFDLDGTLAESKQVLDTEMATLLSKLLQTRMVAVISGGSFTQFEKEFLASLQLLPSALENLILLPTSGGSLYKYKNEGWHQVYEEQLSNTEIEEIIPALEAAAAKSGLEPSEHFGERIENRRDQITYSALGQQAPLAAKESWDPHQVKRKKIVELLKETLHGYNIRIGGTTSIDITRKGVDKAYGIRKLSDYLHIPITDMLFVGDALFPGGNDDAAHTTGIDCVAVKDVTATKKFIETLLVQ